MQQQIVTGEVVPAAFDLGALDPEARIVVAQEDKEFERHMEDAGAGFVRACHSLRRIHEALRYKRPGFDTYCESKSGLSRSTAYRMLDIAEKCPDSGHFSFAGREVFYLLFASSTPEPARIEALARAEAGEHIGHKEAQQIVAAYKPTPPPADLAEEPLSSYEERLAAQIPPPPAANALTAEEKELLASLGIEMFGERSPAGKPPVIMIRTAGGPHETDLATLRRTIQAAREWPKGTRVQTPKGPGTVSIIGRLGTAGQVSVALDGARLTDGMPWVAVADLTPLDEETPAPREPSRELAMRGVGSMADPAIVPADWDAWRARAEAIPRGSLRLSEEGTIILYVGMTGHREPLARWIFVQELIESYERKDAPQAAEDAPAPDLIAGLAHASAGMRAAAAAQQAAREAAILAPTGASGDLYQRIERGPIAEILRLSPAALCLLNLVRFGGEVDDTDADVRENVWEFLTSDAQELPVAAQRRVLGEGDVRKAAA